MAIGSPAVQCQNRIKNFYCCRFHKFEAEYQVKTGLKISTVVDRGAVAQHYRVKTGLKISTVVDNWLKLETKESKPD